MSTITLTPARPTHLPSDAAYAMCHALAGHEEISDACAVTIASWWQSPTGYGLAFAQLASAGTVEYEALADAIQAARLEARYLDDRLALDMLATWALLHPSRTPAVAPATALAQIHGILSGSEWSADTLDEIAAVITAAGYTIEEPR